MFKQLLCYILGHRYYIIQEFNCESRKVGCHRCHATWAMHDPTRSFLPWDADLDELYADYPRPSPTIYP